MEWLRFCFLPPLPPRGVTIMMQFAGQYHINKEQNMSSPWREIMSAFIAFNASWSVFPPLVMSVHVFISLGLRIVADAFRKWREEVDRLTCEIGSLHQVQVRDDPVSK